MFHLDQIPIAKKLVMNVEEIGYYIEYRISCVPIIYIDSHNMIKQYSAIYKNKTFLRRSRKELEQEKERADEIWETHIVAW